MRTMDIPCFAQKVEITNLVHLYKTRLQQKLAPHAAFAIPLLGYMGWPNDGAAREDAMQMLRAWLDGDEPREFLQQIPLMHQRWGRVADTVLLQYGMNEGGHQKRRGGPSVGKAISLAAKRIKARGASQANMWEGWSTYKDAAHLIAAVIAVCADIQRRNREEPLGTGLQEMLPIRVGCAPLFHVQAHRLEVVPKVMKKYQDQLMPDLMFACTRWRSGHCRFSMRTRRCLQRHWQ